jgi:two-component system, chemotaxis family, CheB/CheR fusion protein
MMHSLKILVADDESDCRNSLARLLRCMGHHVWPIARGATVSNISQIIRPDLILVDIRMPGINGYEVARRLRTRDIGARVVALSGLATEQAQREAFEAGFDDYITKPIEIPLLERLLNSVPALV